MEIGIVGLGRMGAGMARRLARAGVHVICYDQADAARGAVGAENYAKMIHNGIEYGMMQALAEGFALIAARPELDIDPARLAETWRHGSVVRSWLLDLCGAILKENEDLSGIAPVVDDSGAGRWTAVESIELGVPAPVIITALMSRFSSQGRSDHAR